MMDLGAGKGCGRRASPDGWRGRGLAPTGPKNIIDKVDDLLMGDEAAAGSGVLLAVLEQGACDVLDGVLWRYMLRRTLEPPGPKTAPCPTPSSIALASGQWVGLTGGAGSSLG